MAEQERTTTEISTCYSTSGSLPNQGCNIRAGISGHRLADLAKRGIQVNQPLPTKNYEISWLAPYLDTETLSEDPMRLLALIHRRSQLDMTDWILFDGEQLNKGFHLDVFDMAYNPHWVVAYGEKFGKLVQWEASACHRYDIIGYSCARQILRVQRSILGLLRTVVDHLLKHRRDRIPDDNSYWNDMVMNGFRNLEKDLVGSSYYERAVFGPPIFNICRIILALQARLDAADDELW
jgi:hypothetical protein